MNPINMFICLPCLYIFSENMVIAPRFYDLYAISSFGYRQCQKLLHETILQVAVGPACQCHAGVRRYPASIIPVAAW